MTAIAESGAGSCAALATTTNFPETTGVDPLYRPPDPREGRWQHGVVVWYFPGRADTAWAEWYRALPEIGLPPAPALPRNLWRWQVDLDRVALLGDDDRLGRMGLPPALPSAGQWPAC